MCDILGIEVPQVGDYLHLGKGCELPRYLGTGSTAATDGFISGNEDKLHGPITELGTHSIIHRSFDGESEVVNCVYAKILNQLYGTKRADDNASEFYVINVTEGIMVMCQIADGRAVNATQQIHRPRPSMSAATAAAAPVTPPRADTPPE